MPDSRKHYEITFNGITTTVLLEPSDVARYGKNVKEVKGPSAGATDAAAASRRAATKAVGRAANKAAPAPENKADDAGDGDPDNGD